ncbi:hypothetical protein E4T42_01779 [Aureobasidium subglaciale]|nr:hypothetical protein E4T42_01779 [Aureobasidium subglaciale]
MSAPISQSLFFRLPPELRLDIYRQLLIHNPHCAFANSKPTFLPTSIDYHGGHHTAIEHPEPDAVALCIRAEDPAHYKLRAAKHVRSAFIVRSGGLRPGCIRSLRLVKRALPYEKEYSKAEWATAMEWLGRLRSLKSLTLGIVAGRPGQDGWETVPALRSADFDVLKGTEGMEWIEELLAINGLDNIEVEAIVVHCPFPRSAAMARYIQFSASVDDGSFAVWLKDNMA